MLLAFYKGRGRWTDRLIKFWTRSRYSHVELVFVGDSADLMRGIHYVSFSSSSRDGGVRVKAIDYEPRHWYFFTLPSWLNAEACYEEAQLHVAQNKGYSWRDVIRFVLPFVKTDRDRWFCSEVVLHVLLSHGWPHLADDIHTKNISPGDLAELAGLKR